MNVVLFGRKVWHTCRVAAQFTRMLPSVYYTLLPEIEKQALYNRLQKKFRCEIHREALLRLEHEEDFVAAKGVIIGAFTLVFVLNENSNKRNSSLEIGESTHILEQNNIRACGGRIVIGRKCLISQHVSIIASNHCSRKGIPIQEQSWDERKTGIIIGDDVWVGCGVQVLPGVKIGDGAVIAAGSLVNTDVRENTVVAGVPARVIRERE